MLADLRQDALLKSLRRLNIRQLKRIQAYQGKFTHTDKAYDEIEGRFHPIAVGIGIPEIKGFTPTEAMVTRQLVGCRLSVKRLDGIDGKFYIDPNQDRDLQATVKQLIEEKRLEETD